MEGVWIADSSQDSDRRRHSVAPVEEQPDLGLWRGRQSDAVGERAKLDFLEAVVDASPLRAGKLMPGTHTPIVFPDKLRESPPDYIFVTAWNYADVIRKKESWFQGIWVTAAGLPLLLSHGVQVVLLGASGCFGHMAAAVLGITSPSCPRAAARAGSFSVDDSDDKLRQLLLRAGPGAVVVNAIATLASDIRGDDAARWSRPSRPIPLFPQRLSRLAGDEGARAVHLDRRCVFDQPRLGQRGRDAPDPEDAYGRSKLPRRVGAARPQPALLDRRAGSKPAAGSVGGWRASPEAPGCAAFTDQLWSGLTTRQLALACAVASGRRLCPSPRRRSRPAPGTQPVLSVSAPVGAGAALRPDLIIEPAEASKPACRLLEPVPWLAAAAQRGLAIELAAMVGQLPTTPTLH